MLVVVVCYYYNTDLELFLFDAEGSPLKEINYRCVHMYGMAHRFAYIHFRHTLMAYVDSRHSDGGLLCTAGVL